MAEVKLTSKDIDRLAKRLEDLALTGTERDLLVGLFRLAAGAMAQLTDRRALGPLVGTPLGTAGLGAGLAGRRARPGAGDAGGRAARQQRLREPVGHAAAGAGQSRVGVLPRLPFRTH